MASPQPISDENSQNRSGEQDSADEGSSINQHQHLPVNQVSGLANRRQNPHHANQNTGIFGQHCQQVDTGRPNAPIPQLIPSSSRPGVFQRRPTYNIQQPFVYPWQVQPNNFWDQRTQSPWQQIPNQYQVQANNPYAQPQMGYGILNPQAFQIPTRFVNPYQQHPYGYASSGYPRDRYQNVPLSTVFNSMPPTRYPNQPSVSSRTTSNVRRTRRSKRIASRVNQPEISSSTDSQQRADEMLQSVPHEEEEPVQPESNEPESIDLTDDSTDYVPPADNRVMGQEQALVAQPQDLGTYPAMYPNFEQQQQLLPYPGSLEMPMYHAQQIARMERCFTAAPQEVPFTLRSTSIEGSQPRAATCPESNYQRGRFYPSTIRYPFIRLPHVSQLQQSSYPPSRPLNVDHRFPSPQIQPTHIPENYSSQLRGQNRMTVRYNRPHLPSSVLPTDVTESSATMSSLLETMEDKVPEVMGPSSAPQAPQPPPQALQPPPHTPQVVVPEQQQQGQNLQQHPSDMLQRTTLTQRDYAKSCLQTMDHLLPESPYVGRYHMPKVVPPPKTLLRPPQFVDGPPPPLPPPAARFAPSGNQRGLATSQQQTSAEPLSSGHEGFPGNVMSDRNIERNRTPPTGGRLSPIDLKLEIDLDDFEIF